MDSYFSPDDKVKLVVYPSDKPGYTVHLEVRLIDTDEQLAYIELTNERVLILIDALLGKLLKKEIG